MYSSHDTQISILWEYLEQILEHDSWYYIPYASHVILELRYDSGCIEMGEEGYYEKCFTVKITTNGKEMKFKANGEESIQYREFMEVMEGI